MCKTRTSRIANAPCYVDGYKFQHSNTLTSLVIIFFLLLFISAGLTASILLDNQKMIEKKDKEIFDLKDALKLKTSIVKKEDSAYMAWSTDHALRTRVKNELKKINKF